MQGSTIRPRCQHMPRCERPHAPLLWEWYHPSLRRSPTQPVAHLRREARQRRGYPVWTASVTAVPERSLCVPTSTPYVKSNVRQTRHISPSPPPAPSSLLRPLPSFLVRVHLRPTPPPPAATLILLTNQLLSIWRFAFCLFAFAFSLLPSPLDITPKTCYSPSHQSQTLLDN